MKRVYIQPELSDHEVIYKGRRYTAFKIDAGHPWLGFEEWYNLVVRDCYDESDLIYGNALPDGSFKGSVPYGQNDLEVTGKSIREYIDNTISTWRILEREFRK